jgi:hypothetical protein
MLLPDDDGDDSSCYHLDIGNKDRTVYAKVFVLWAGTWTVHFSTLADLIKSPQEILTMTLLIRGKIYMLTMAGYILTLDLATTRLSLIPREVWNLSTSATLSLAVETTLFSTSSM